MGSPKITATIGLLPSPLSRDFLSAKFGTSHRDSSGSSFSASGQNGSLSSDATQISSPIKSEAHGDLLSTLMTHTDPADVKTILTEYLLPRRWSLVLHPEGDSWFLGTGRKAAAMLINQLQETLVGRHDVMNVQCVFDEARSAFQLPHQVDAMPRQRLSKKRVWPKLDLNIEVNSRDSQNASQNRTGADHQVDTYTPGTTSSPYSGDSLVRLYTSNSPRSLPHALLQSLEPLDGLQPQTSWPPVTARLSFPLMRAPSRSDYYLPRSTSYLSLRSLSVEDGSDEAGRCPSFTETVPLNDRARSPDSQYTVDRATRRQSLMSTVTTFTIREATREPIESTLAVAVEVPRRVKSFNDIVEPIVSPQTTTSDDQESIYTRLPSRVGLRRANRRITTDSATTPTSAQSPDFDISVYASTPLPDTPSSSTWTSSDTEENIGSTFELLSTPMNLRHHLSLDGHELESLESVSSLASLGSVWTQSHRGLYRQCVMVDGQQMSPSSPSGLRGQQSIEEAESGSSGSSRTRRSKYKKNKSPTSPPMAPSRSFSSYRAPPRKSSLKDPLPGESDVDPCTSLASEATETETRTESTEGKDLSHVIHETPLSILLRHFGITEAPLERTDVEIDVLLSEIITAEVARCGRWDKAHKHHVAWLLDQFAQLVRQHPH